MPDRRILYLVDVNNWIFRAFHAIRGLSTRAGLPTNAVFGFTQMLQKLLDSGVAGEPAEHVAAVVDTEEPTFRKLRYDAYKANRPPLPEALAPQFPYIHALIDALGLRRCGAPGFEADDVVATLTRRAVAAGWEVVILSSDKDLAALVGPRVTMWDTMAEKRYGPAEVIEKWGVPPERIPDLLALTGDASDNVPGVRGIGPKGAGELIAKFGSLAGVYEHLEEVAGKKREALRESRADALLSLELVTLREDAPVTGDIDSFRLAPADPDRLYELFRALEFRRFAERWEPLRRSRGGAAVPPAEPPAATPAEPAAATPGEPATATPGEPATASLTAPAAFGRDVALVTDEAGLTAMVAALERTGAFAFDLETTSLTLADAEIVGLSFAPDPGRAWYVPVAHRGLTALPPQLPLPRVLAATAPLFATADVRRIAQNHKYDVTILARYGITVGPIDFDPMLGSYLLDPGTYRHNMDDLALQWLDFRTTKYEDLCGKGRDQIPFERVPVDRAAAYCGQDSQVAFRLTEVLRPRVEAAGLDRVLRELELPLAPILGRMELHGVLVDPPRLEVLSRRFAERMITLEREAHAAAGVPFNLGSPKQLAEVLFDRLKLEPGRRTKTGRSTDSDVLEVLAGEHPLPRLVLDWRLVQKLRSTYAEALRQLVHPRTHRIHTSFHQAVAATGRLSSSDPNLQNIPVRREEGREIRAAFVAPPGHVLLSADYSQVELRLLAHLSGDEALTRAFREGADVHTRTAAEIFGVAEAAVTREQRTAAKAINFGIIYGMGANRLARDTGLSRAEAQATIARYFQRYAGVKRYLEETVEAARRSGEVRTLLGRRRLLPELTSNEPRLRALGERTAVNTPVQGSAADVIKLAMLRVEQAFATAGLRARMVLQVHDELVFEVPEDELEEVSGLVREAMEGVHPLRVPLRIDIHTGADWREAHA